MAHAILESCPVRIGLPTNMLLQHKASAGSGGTATEIQGYLEVLQGLELYLNTLEAKRIGITLADMKEKVTHPWVTFGQDSLNQKLLDRIADVTCEASLYKTRNGCPLVEFTQEK